MDSALLGGLSKAHGGAIKRHGASAKQRFMRSTTSKIAAGIGLASIANLASQRQQQKAFLQATSGKSAKEIDALFDKITDNANQAAEANFLSKAQAFAGGQASGPSAITAPRRTPATKAPAVFKGTAGVSIPQNLELQSASGQRYRTSQSGILSAQGTATITLKAVQGGVKGNASAGALFTLASTEG